MQQDRSERAQRSHASVPDPSHSGFFLTFRTEASSHCITSIFLLPEEKLSLAIVDSSDSAYFYFTGDTDSLRKVEGVRQWDWTAPRAHGNYHLMVRRAYPPDSMFLNLIVMLPFRELRNEYIGSYRIGTYPKPRLGKQEFYLPPRGFIEVRESDSSLLLTPHFALGQFITKQGGGYPKYVVLEERQLFLLEEILGEVNKRGYMISSFHVMSGYRTPYYNALIGNVPYSRHVWGDATDFFVDENPRDGMMDDLNGDGKIDIKDAGVIYEIINEMSKAGRPIGGLGKYPASGTHGPFIHVDVRGFKARW